MRVTGEMSWASRVLPGSQRLIEYEMKLNGFLPGSKCIAICQYDRRRFAPALLLDVLRAHPVVIIGTSIYDNFYYIPPSELLCRDTPDVDLRHWVKNLAERKRAEEALRENEKRFHASLENMLDCFGLYSVIRDESGRIVDFRIDYVNKAACANNRMAKRMFSGLAEHCSAKAYTIRLDSFIRRSISITSGPDIST